VSIKFIGFGGQWLPYGVNYSWLETVLVKRQVEVHAGPVAPTCLCGGICRELTVKQDLESHWDLAEPDGAL